MPNWNLKRGGPYPEGQRDAGDGAELPGSDQDDIGWVGSGQGS